MRTTPCSANSKIGFAICAAPSGTLTECSGYRERQRPARVYAQPAPVYVESGPVGQDDYVYHPGYQAYYSSHRRQYIYLEGRSWVSRPTPPHVAVDVFFASPSVRLDFHDGPASHHEMVVRQYPKHWAPSGGNQGQKDVHDNGNRNGRHGRD